VKKSIGLAHISLSELSVAMNLDAKFSDYVYTGKISVSSVIN